MTRLRPRLSPSCPRAPVMPPEKIWRPIHQWSLMFRPGLTRTARLVTAYVTLDKPAPKGGAVIRLSPTSSTKTYAWSQQKEIVIAEGDPLFGSTVSSLQYFHGLNDLGDIAFQYKLANGWHGVAIASAVPEPSAAGVIVAIASAAFLGRRRRC